MAEVRRSNATEVSEWLKNWNSKTSPSYPDLAQSTVFITGGASGIGAYLCAAFALQGARVAFVSLEGDPGELLCDELEMACGHRPLYLPCDIKNVAVLKQKIEQVEKQFGMIDILINNAARDTRHDVKNLSQTEWDESMNTNLRPHFFTAQSVVPGMKKKGGGSIINIGSNSANLGLSGYPAYVAAKAGIVGLTKALARELGADNIRVNALIPGWVMTERQKKMWVTPEALDACLAQQCLKKTVEGQDIAQAALFLASSASTMMTGQSLIVDGGRV